MSKITIIEGNSNNKDNVRAIMVKGEKGEQGDVNLSQLNEEKTIRQNNDNNLQSQINGLASGSPLVASSVAGMTDTSKIYVNTTDGHWYYYNGSAWIIGGAYQSTGIDNNSINHFMTTFIEKDESNLITLPIYAKTINGVNLSINEYGKCVLNGTTTAYTHFDIPLDLVNVGASQKYFCTKNCPDNYNLFSQVLMGKNSANNTNEIVSGITTDYNKYYYTFPNKAWVDNSFYLYISIDPNKTFENIEFYPAIFDGNYTENPEDWGLKFKKSVYMTKKEIENYVKEKTNMLPLKITPKQLFNYNSSTLVTGKYIDFRNGNEATDQYYCYDIIPIDYTKEYIIKNDRNQISFYNSDMIFISGIDTQASASTPIQIPQYACYAAISVQINKKETLMVEYGQIQHKYENYISNMKLGEILQGYDMTDLNNLYYQRISNIISSLYNSNVNTHIKFLGDSITAGQGGTGYSPKGETIMTDSRGNTFKANEQGYCWANLMKSYLESKFNCSIKNWGVSGKDSGWLNLYKEQLIENEDEILVVCFGTNDRSNNTDTFSNLRNFVNYSNNLGKKVILMSNIPASLSNEANYSVHMEDIDNRINYLATTLNTEYVSLFKLMKQYLKYTDTTLDSILNDGLHPNDNGYKIMFELISNSLGIGTKIDNATW